MIIIDHNDIKLILYKVSGKIDDGVWYGKKLYLTERSVLLWRGMTRTVQNVIIRLRNVHYDNN